MQTNNVNTYGGCLFLTAVTLGNIVRSAVQTQKMILSTSRVDFNISKKYRDAFF